MSKQDYPWKRFWCPRTGHTNLGDRGYLVDPTTEWGKHYNPDLVEMEAIVNAPCLVLLGEPGMGKSQEMENLAKHTEVNIHRPHVLIELNLRSQNLAIDLLQDPDFMDWMNGEQHLYLFLDSLDEGLLEVGNLATQVVDEFSKKKYQDKLCRLYLRIACRTAIVPQVLEQGLEKLWKELKIYELVPLRYADVEIAAKMEGIDPQSFLVEVGDRNLVPFAIKPVTLTFLFNIYKRHGGQFPLEQTLRSLYLEGCRLLCEEVNLSRHGRILESKLEPEQRLIVAARIAAVTVFSNRFAVWTGIDQGEVPVEDVVIRDLVMGSETANGKGFEVSEATIREVLDSGLFSSRGANRMGWAHQTYAEFLAAWYLTQHDLSLSKILNLILHLDGRVIPQLQETTAWLANMRTDVFQKVVELDPDVLLQSDLAKTNEANKFLLVKSLLELHAQDKLAYQYRYQIYKSLEHSELAAQLQPYILDSRNSLHSRYLAIDIAEDCNVKAVQSELLDVALDINQPYWVRTRAASALVCIGDEQTKVKLEPLAAGDEKDLEDELKGYALQAICPTHMTTEKILNSLSQPKAPYIGGTYQDFIARKLGQLIPDTDIPIVLRWLKKQPTLRDLHYPFNAFSDAIMLRAWEHLEKSEVLYHFSQIALIRLSQHDSLIDFHEMSFKQLLAEDDVKRRCLLEAVISLTSKLEQEPVWLTGYSEWNQLTPLAQDFFWLVEKLQMSESDRIQKIYAKLIRWKLDWHNSSMISAVIIASQSNNILRAEFLPNLEPILLDSNRAKQAILEYAEDQEMILRNKKKLLDPLPKTRVLIHLEQFEAGSIEAWYNLCLDMTLLPTSTNYNENFNANLTKLPGWQDAEESTKLRIIEAAKRYLQLGEPDTHAWLGTSSFRYSALSGYKALLLLLVKEPEYIATLTVETWEKWVGIILSYPRTPSASKDNEEIQQLIERAYLNTPDEFIKVINILIDKENSGQNGCSHILDKIECCWDDRLAKFLFDKMHDDELTAKNLGDLLKELLVHHFIQAENFAKSLISLPLSTTGELRAKTVIVAQILMLYAEGCGWSIVWNLIQQDSKFGRSVLESVSYVNKYKGNIEHRLKEDNLADLYVFLVKEYPDLGEKQATSGEAGLSGVEAYLVKPEDSIRTWRDYIPQRLQERATPEACDALRKIIHELPEQKEQMQQRLLETENLVRRRTWKPPTLEELLQLILVQEPPNSTLFNQLEELNQRTQKMADDPKIDNSVNISGSNNVNISGSNNNISGANINTGDGIAGSTLPENKAGLDWKYWLGLAVTIMGVAASGVFNDEIRRWFIKPEPSPPVEQKLDKQTD
jgi:predicted NACHT family NTPase